MCCCIYSMMAGMGLIGSSVGCVLLLGFCCSLSSTQHSSWGVSPFSNPGLYCGSQSLQFIVPTSLQKPLSVKLNALDKRGNAQLLSNSSICGTRLSVKDDGSVVVTAAYDGCHVHEKNYDHIMTLLIEREYTAGKWTIPQSEELRCPMLEALDAPSSDHCSDVKKEERMSCASSPASQDICQRRGCCFDPSDRSTPCYYGDKVTVQCSKDGQISIAVSKDLTLPPLIVDSVRLIKGEGVACSPVQKNNAFVLFQFPLSTCGTTFRDSGNYALYENNVLADTDVRTWRAASITRDSTLRLHVRCSFASTDIVPLNVSVFTLPPPLPATSFGPLTLDMRIAKDDQYLNYYVDGDYPVIKLLRDPVPIEVRILQRTDPNLVLVLHQCWASTTEDPMHQPQWPVLVDGCPFTGDNYKTQQLTEATYAGLNFPSHYKRFIVNTFTFVDASLQVAFGGLVYFHCSASACFPSTLDSCVTLCQQRKRRSASNATNYLRELVSSHGPVYIQSELDSNAISAKGSPVTSSLLDQEWFRIAVVASVLAVMLVTLGLWRLLKKNCKVQTLKSLIK